MPHPLDEAIANRKAEAEKAERAKRQELWERCFLAALTGTAASRLNEASVVEAAKVVADNAAARIEACRKANETG